jgi:hypothetical protein
VGQSVETGTACHSGKFYDETTQNVKLVFLETFKWSSFGLLKATKLVKPGNTALGAVHK